ncbi:hypothetical protein M378DRAFT_162551 [Amanita muscaria Koide BX008]|uniref:Secreted protein n=1 Tax=Amanita muscaria (strain Koide BX008) TaxID=946122 RepID=A0A0C2X6T1_AMAMK|nr:hypothetical protein M378DRAFT_162551 [Amanita muscaria Koide BX008]
MMRRIPLNKIALLRFLISFPVLTEQIRTLFATCNDRGGQTPRNYRTRPSVELGKHSVLKIGPDATWIFFGADLINYAVAGSYSGRSHIQLRTLPFDHPNERGRLFLCS